MTAIMSLEREVVRIVELCCRAGLVDGIVDVSQLMVMQRLECHQPPTHLRDFHLLQMNPLNSVKTIKKELAQQYPVIAPEIKLDVIVLVITVYIYSLPKYI